MVARRLALAAALVAGACGEDEAPVFAPYIEVPAPGSDAYPYGELELVELSVAHAGDSGAIRLAQFEPGEPLVLADVPYGDDLVVRMSGLIAGDLAAFGTTCPVALRPGEPLPEPHLYFARLLQWADGAAPQVGGRSEALVHVARDGSAAFYGGVAPCATGSCQLSAAERFDPRAGAFAELPAATAARTGAVLAPFGDGRALIVGGVGASGDGVDFVEVVSPLDPVLTRQVATIATSELRLRDHAAAALVDGSVVVFGGLLQPATGGEFVPTAQVWRFALGPAGVLEWTGVEPLAEPRYGHTVTRIGNDDDPGAAVLVVGGVDDMGNFLDAALFEPLQAGFADFAATLNFPRLGHRAARLGDGSVLVIGGRDALGELVLPLERYFEGRFAEAMISLDPVAQGVEGMSVTPLPNGTLLVAGGRNAAGAPVDTVFIARIGAQGTVDFVRTDSLHSARADHAAVLLCDGTVLLVGGTTDPEAPGSERYNPLPDGRE